jgi:hypothetical protein
MDRVAKSDLQVAQRPEQRAGDVVVPPVEVQRGLQFASTGVQVGREALGGDRVADLF